MKYYACVFSVLLAVAFAQTDNSTTTTKPTTTSTKPTTTSTVPPTTTSTNPPTTTSTPPTSTQTPKPTTAPPTPPTPKPTPDPVNPPRPDRLDAGNWNVTKNGSLCLKAHFAAEIIVPYMASTGVVHNATIAVPANALATGACEALVLAWPTSNLTNSSNFLVMNFTTGTVGNDTRKFYMPSVITAILANDPFFFPNATGDSFKNNAILVSLVGSTDFTAPVNNSFRCYTERQLKANLTDPIVQNNTGFFLFKDVQIQPMVPTGSTGFGAAITCDLDRGLTSDIVPIAVGCALAGLVVVVIIAYIIGRRRSRQSGYTSV